jgi:hypothetical protein
MVNNDKADENLPNPGTPRYFAIKITTTKELAGVDIWASNEAPEFLTILLTEFILFFTKVK